MLHLPSWLSRGSRQHASYCDCDCDRVLLFRASSFLIILLCITDHPIYDGLNKYEKKIEKLLSFYFRRIPFGDLSFDSLRKP